MGAPAYPSIFSPRRESRSAPEASSRATIVGTTAVCVAPRSRTAATNSSGSQEGWMICRAPATRNGSTNSPDVWVIGPAWT